jgi:hypothetical protein
MRESSNDRPRSGGGCGASRVTAVAMHGDVAWLASPHCAAIHGDDEDQPAVACRNVATGGKLWRGPADAR